VQALEARTTDLDERVRRLEAENAALKTRLAELEALEQRLTRLEVALTTPTEDAETARADD
jgi:predicted nuclease with TOPRIM domain